MIKDLSEQLQTKDDDLKMEKEKNSKLQKKLEESEKQVVNLSNKIAML